MNFREYSELALRTAKQLDTRDRLINGALGLGGESGEVLDLIKKKLFHDRQIIDHDIQDELGDVLWYVNLIANAIGTDLKQIASKNIQKLEARHPQGFSSTYHDRSSPNRPKLRQFDDPNIPQGLGIASSICQLHPAPPISSSRYGYLSEARIFPISDDQTLEIRGEWVLIVDPDSRQLLDLETTIHKRIPLSEIPADRQKLATIFIQSQTSLIELVTQTIQQSMEVLDEDE